MSRLAPIAILSLTLLPLAPGCASSDKPEGVKRVEQTTESLETYQAEVVNLRREVDATLNSLRAVANPDQSDPRPAFAQFVRQLDEQEATATRARQLADRMSGRSDAHFAAWEKELESVSNRDIRARMTERREEYRSKFQDTSDVMATARSAYAPFMADLKDLRKYLNNDLTPAGIGSARDLIEQTTASGGEVQDRLDAVVAALDELIVQFAPTTAPTTQSATDPVGPTE